MMIQPSARSYVPVARVDADGVLRDGSMAFARMLGYRADEISGRSVCSLLHPEHRARFRRGRDLVLRACVPGEHRRLMLVWFDRSGRLVRTRATLAPLASPGDLELRVVSRQEPALDGFGPGAELPQEPADAYLRAILEATATAMLLVDERGVTRLANAAAASLLRRSPGDLAGQPLDALLGGCDGFPEELVSPGKRLSAALARGEGERFSQWGMLGDGRAVELRSVPLADIPVPLALVELVDITESQRREAQLRYLARFDALTGLPNRELFLERLREACRESPCGGFALGYVDVDRFKRLNEAFGPHAGDDVLCEVAERLRGLAGEQDTVARLGSDEFGLLLQGDDVAVRLSQVMEALPRAMSTPLFAGGREVFLTASSGWATLPNGERESVARLLARAEAALFEAKRSGRGGVMRYRDDMASARPDRLRLEVALRHALEREEFDIRYQPVLRLGSGRLHGVEALLRWRRADGSLEAPGEFVTVLEETGLIRAAGEWLLRRACRDVLALDVGPGPQPVLAVNVSADQVRDARFVDLVEQILTETGFPAERLVIEITESLLMDTGELVQSSLRRLDELGVALAIDDFGIGYSSLAYLKRFPVDTLKIDRSFIAELADSPDDQAIVGAMMAMAGSLGLTVVAEGVETEAQADYLRQWPELLVQGFLYARPMSLADLRRWPGCRSDARRVAGG
jgi:diguanylate cyclase (GGDEF)-like protein/PAS domain S-box-containing protein